MLDTFFFYAFALMAVAGAILTITLRSAVHCAMALIASLAGVAGLYLAQSAEFLFAVQIVLYIGGIMVLFLFVIMLLGAEQTGRTPAAWWLQPAALVLGVILLIEATYIVITQRDMLPAAGEVSAAFGGPVSVGETLFSQYVLPFEVTSILLLVAMIGAIVLSRRRA